MYDIDQQDVNENSGVGLLISIFHFLFFLPLVFDRFRDSNYLKMRANYSLMICVANILLTSLTKVLSIGIIAGILNFAVCILWVVHIVFALKNRTDPLPVIGSIEIIK